MTGPETGQEQTRPVQMSQKVSMASETSLGAEQDAKGTSKTWNPLGAGKA